MKFPVDGRFRVRNPVKKCLAKQRNQEDTKLCLKRRLIKEKNHKAKRQYCYIDTLEDFLVSRDKGAIFHHF